ncbi:hypothetical protein J2Z62_000036 [Mycoplasmoides fastidiosum]|uniref:Lipoprotein-associated type-17 domain-containing protein n=1 Tax=Mycoplasmoides fastidiosum TaxID=92758 RepID=A0ABU0LYC5_9BACT|nr:lipoprotein 17-related variable surface protein [Mycoplasmoides fastidiosum]MDQ0513598.1 hypothetical protein [Mycoplasmoides fastidiosum]UUD37979.1 lipoprotein 17-related variable surface protein [Mycoplasmoides fastidiosum]
MKKKLHKWSGWFSLALTGLSIIGWWSGSVTSWSTTPIQPIPSRLIQQQAEVVNQTSEADNTYLYRPGALVFQPHLTNWTPKYPSQITPTDLAGMFSFTQQTSSTGLPTATASGYEFQTVTNNQATKVEISNLQTTFKHGLGQLANQTTNLIIEIVSANDVLGSVDFRVYQPISAYSLTNGVYSNIQLTDSANYRVLILPPQNQQASTTDPSLWKWKQQPGLKQAQFQLQWNSDANIISFINQTALKASAITADWIKTNFLITTADRDQALAYLTPNDLQVTTHANDAEGWLRVDVKLSEHFANPTKTFSRTFFGFKTTQPVTADDRIKLHLLTNDQLLNAEIQAPLWETQGTDSWVGQTVQNLLPTQFLTGRNPAAGLINYSLLDLITGQPITTGAAESGVAPLKVNATGFNNEIGYLSLANQRWNQSNEIQVPEFQITNVKGFGNDRTGEVDLIIYYQTVNNAGSLIPAAPMHVQYKGFNTNPLSGSSLFFSWNSSLPTEFANFSSAKLWQLFKNQINDPNYNGGYLTTPAAKTFVQQFFTSSQAFLTEFNRPYNANNQGAQVSVRQVSSNDHQLTNLQISIQMGHFNNQTNQVLTNTFLVHGSQTNLAPDQISTIAPKPVFLLENHQFANRLASSLTDAEILEMFQLTIPASGAGYTTSFDQVKVFSIANDQTGELVVLLLFPQFNGIANYEFNFRINYFKTNQSLAQGLSLTHVPVINLPATFLARNPLDPNDLTAAEILVNLFSSLPSAIANLLEPKDLTVVERTTNSVVVDLKLNWNQLLERTNNSNNSLTQQSRVVHQQDVHDETDVLRFVISGFLSPNNLIVHNQNPQNKGAVLDTTYIILIGLILTGLLLILVLVSAGVFHRRQQLFNQDPSAYAQKPVRVQPTKKPVTVKPIPPKSSVAKVIPKPAAKSSTKFSKSSWFNKTVKTTTAPTANLNKVVINNEAKTHSFSHQTPPTPSVQPSLIDQFMPSAATIPAAPKPAPKPKPVAKPVPPAARVKRSAADIYFASWNNPPTPTKKPTVDKPTVQHSILAAGSTPKTRASSLSKFRFGFKKNPMFLNIRGSKQTPTTNATKKVVDRYHRPRNTMSHRSKDWGNQ